MELRINRRALIALGVAGALSASSLALLRPETSGASSHREAPLIAGDPRNDNTDLYAFTSPDRPETVTLIANWLPFEEPTGGPNFYTFDTRSRYNIKIDNDGDAKPDVVYQWTFRDEDRRGTTTFLYNNGQVTSIDDENLLFRQRYTLRKFTRRGAVTLVRNGVVAPSNTGAASMPDYATLRAQSVKGLPNGGRTFAGQADDPFFLDLRVFDLLYGGDLSEVGQDTLKGYNVHSIALQVPKHELALNGDARRNPVVGVWSTTDKWSPGGYRQVSRLGNPLVNEVVLPAGLKDTFNAISPDKDAGIAAVVQRVTKPELPKLIEAIYKIPAPKTPRADLVEIFLTGIAKANGPIKADLNSQLLNRDARARAFRPSEMLRLNMAVPPARDPNRLGVLAGDLQGFPNGRRLGDDVVDISLQAVEGAAQSGELVQALATGDQVNENDRPLEGRFPYVPLPHTAAVNQQR
ncbi:hypothetical protein Sme01_06550 [Sphaerisporangium melleum]|uniref:DUF4331 domain-containing protein n=1 Tax=Sphaerisporangium melleum TaxID=321316 RepID=A0A917RLG5_9ACTN|nr:DUF4331 domain-containing protein [Sphaerisporangium melleum]GGL14299.1 hypothetical protein GCM10007964_65400 [Sphaerisporangium melleum]GII68179.1 hypothetical protein Sme01_06550 [Sphaerisporangium melleum]